MSEDVEGRELPPTMLQPVSFDDSPDQEAELRPSCGCADADRTYAELEAEFLRVSGELIVAHNRVKGLEENEAELLARAEQAEAATEQVRALRQQVAEVAWGVLDGQRVLEALDAALDAPETPGGES